MARLYYKFKTKEEQSNLLYKLIKAIESFELGSGFSEDLINIYECLNRNTTMLDENKNQVLYFTDFIKLLYTVEPINWFKETVNKRGKFVSVWHNDIVEEYADLLSYPLVLEDGFLSDDALTFIDNYYSVDKSSDEIEQGNMRKIIELLRATDDRDSQFIYTYIRNNVIAINGEINLKTKRPVYSIRDEYQYIEFKNEFIKPKYNNKYDVLDEKVDGLFEKIEGPYLLTYCAYCGSKMYKVKEEYVCPGRSVCKNNLNPGEIQTLFREVPVGESIYIPKRGVSRYNVIPGIDELYLIRLLEQKFGGYDFVIIEAYPGKDGDGDVKITIGKKNILIDVKSWKKSQSLINHIKNNEFQFKDKDYVYIPMYLKNEYDRKLNSLNEVMSKIGLKTKAVSIGILEKIIKKEIDKYINDPDLYNEDSIISNEVIEDSVQISLI